MPPVYVAPAMRVPRILQLALLTSAPCNVAFAQDSGALEQLNAGFAGALVFSTEGASTLVIDWRDPQGRYRLDRVPLALVDAEALDYSLHEDAIVLNGGSGCAACFTQEHLRMGMMKRASRIAVPVPFGDPAGRQAMQLIATIIASAQERLAETRTRP